MKPWPRVRKAVKWGGVVLTALLLVTWLTSIWWFARAGTGTGYSSIVSGGGITIGFDPGTYFVRDAAWCEWGAARTSMGGWFSAFDNGVAWSFFCPLWPLLFLGAGATVLVWRNDTLARRHDSFGSCQACGYALEGLPNGSTCPECGHPDARPRP